MPAPINDNFDNAIELFGIEDHSTVLGMEEATVAVNEKDTIQAQLDIAGLTIPAPDNTMWWKWTAPADGIVSVDSFGSLYGTPGNIPQWEKSGDTVVGVFTGTSIQDLELVVGTTTVSNQSANLLSENQAGIESGITGFTPITTAENPYLVEPSLTQSSDIAKSGTYSLKIVSREGPQTNASSSGFRIDGNVENLDGTFGFPVISDGRRYDIVFWLNSNYVPSALYINGYGYDANGTFTASYPSMASITTVDNTWQVPQIHVDGYITDNIDNMVLEVLLSVNQTSVIDDIDNYATNWVDQGNPTSEISIQSLCKLLSDYPAGVILAGTRTNGHILRSLDYGKNWTDLGQQFSASGIWSLAPTGATNVVLAGTSGDGSAHVLISTDSGETWNISETISTGAGTRTVYSVCALDADIFLAGTGDGHIWRSINAGMDWTDLGVIHSAQNIQCLKSLGGGLVLAGTSGAAGKILRSTDYGATWSDLGQQYSQGGIYDFGDFGDGIVVASTGFTQGHILRSTDYGATWSDLGQQYSLTRLTRFAIATDFPNSSVGIVGGLSGRILRTDDRGATWTDLGQQASEFEVMSAVYLQRGIFLTGTSMGGKILKSVLPFTPIYMDDISLTSSIKTNTASGSGTGTYATKAAFATDTHGTSDTTEVYDWYLNNGTPENEGLGGPGDNGYNGNVIFDATQGTTYYFLLGLWDGWNPNPVYEEFSNTINLYFTPTESPVKYTIGLIMPN